MTAENISPIPAPDFSLALDHLRSERLFENPTDIASIRKDATDYLRIEPVGPIEIFTYLALSLISFMAVVICLAFATAEHKRHLELHAENPKETVAAQAFAKSRPFIFGAAGALAATVIFAISCNRHCRKFKLRKDKIDWDSWEKIDETDNLLADIVMGKGFNPEGVKSSSDAEAYLERYARELAARIDESSPSQRDKLVNEDDPVASERATLRSLVDLMARLGLMGSSEFTVFPLDDNDHDAVIAFRASHIYEQLFRQANAEKPAA